MTQPVVFVLNPNDPREMAEAERLNERVVHRALSLDGTCTGEHGIGCGKIDFLIAEHGDAVSVMHAIKKALDPDNIVNPGKSSGSKTDGKMDVLINIQGTTEDVLDEPTAALFQQQWQLFSARNTRPCGKETR